MKSFTYISFCHLPLAWNGRCHNQSRRHKYKITYPDGVFAGIYLDISVKTVKPAQRTTGDVHYTKVLLNQLQSCETVPLLILVPQRLLTKILDFSVPTNVKKFLRTLPGR